MTIKRRIIVVQCGFRDLAGIAGVQRIFPVFGLPDFAVIPTNLSPLVPLSGPLLRTALALSAAVCFCPAVKCVTLGWERERR